MEMTEEEICRNYLQAANPLAQIKILADLNVTSKDEIKRVLRSHGIEAKTSARRGRVSCIWTPENERKLKILMANGLTQTEIAKELGLTRSTVNRKFSQIKKCPAAAGTTEGRG